MDILRASAARCVLKWHSTVTRPRNWVCQSCLHSSRSSSRFESSTYRRTFTAGTILRSTTTTATATATKSSTEKQKPYYVTTPIFYVNASPHVGHMYSMVLADVLKRWQILAGRKAFLCTGTDEHGMKVQQAAARADVAPMQWCDQNAEKFKELCEAANISPDRFIRTTDADHVDAVKHFWFLLEKKGLIYETKHEGWYCVSDECFYPESMIHKTKDVFTGEVFMASVETGNKVEWIEEKNYHFRMTALREKLLRFYDENPEWIVPASGMTQVVDWVRNHLEDLSISRPSSRLQWGIRVPEDPSQTIYVWVDALVNYLTFGGFPNWQPGREAEGGWPADVHVIGKDILRFHGVYWPALLLALDLPLPKQLLSHAHWTLDHRKMSKSKGNAVNPFVAIQRFGVDAMRFYMVHDGGIADDADYHNEIIVERYKKHLQNGVGNLLARITRSKMWKFSDAVTTARSYHHGRDGYERSPLAPDSVAGMCREHAKYLDTVLTRSVEGHMDQMNPGLALRSIMDAIAKANKFLQNTMPWYFLKDVDAVNYDVKRKYAHVSLFLVGETLRMSGILLQPFMPEKAARLLDLLDVSPDRRTLEYARLYADREYGMKADGGDVTAASVSTDKVLLVPYDSHHVLTYHGWMEDPDIQQATASEPLTLEEEYENQQSWRASHDKMTFIVCQPLSTSQQVVPADEKRTVQAGLVDTPDKMIGDINLFLSPYDEDDDDTVTTASYVGEVDIMIADKKDQGRGTGKAAVLAFLAYLSRHVDEILGEYTTSLSLEQPNSTSSNSTGTDVKKTQPKLHSLMAKINQTNERSIALFESLGFAQEGEVNFFGEVKLVLSGEEFARRFDTAVGSDSITPGYEELVYVRTGEEEGRP
ncbi:methionyl-tRNA synthetase [Naviculisporaceae sp. PSN 640]